MGSLKYAAVVALDWFDVRVLGHRFHRVCLALGESSWWGVAGIERRPAGVEGEPYFGGTSISVDEVLGKLDAGETEAKVFAAHPELTPAALRAAQRWRDSEHGR